MPAYSFQDVTASISGPGGNFDLKGGNPAEGITIEATGDKNIMTVGADAHVMHSLRADDSGLVTVRLLKTSPVNALMQSLYNSQKQSSATWGKNVISIRDIARGDDITATECAFAGAPTYTYAEEGGMMEWRFHAGKVDPKLGSGEV